MSVCEKCGKEYETYPIILCNNPLSITSYLEYEQKEDGSFRRICEECRENGVEQGMKGILSKNQRVHLEKYKNGGVLQDLFEGKKKLKVIK